MDWTIVASVLVALLLFPVALAFMGALMFVTAATLFRGRVRELKEHAAHCREMCSLQAQGASCATTPEQASCRGAGN